jgi:hypothetical protein
MIRRGHETTDFLLSMTIMLVGAFILACIL